MSTEIENQKIIPVSLDLRFGMTKLYSIMELEALLGTAVYLDMVFERSAEEFLTFCRDHVGLPDISSKEAEAYREVERVRLTVALAQKAGIAVGVVGV